MITFVKNNIIKIAGSLKRRKINIETTECTTDNNFTKKPFKTKEEAKVFQKRLTKQKRNKLRNIVLL